jgi:hypothetical protein
VGEEDAACRACDEYGGLFPIIAITRFRHRSSAVAVQGKSGEVLKYLLDTDVVSQMIKDRPNPRVDAWLRGTENEEMYLSLVTLAELKLGAQLLQSGPKRRRLEEWLGLELMYQFEGRLLPVDLDTADAYAVLVARTRKSGFTPVALDALIAATAVANGMKVVTLNRKDFELLGVELVEF